jgi:ribonuclease VapC
MIVDSSVIIAILRDERDAKALGRALAGARLCRISAANYVESAVLVDSNRNPVLSRRMDELLRDVGITIEPVTVNQARIAREAYRDFGKGRHKAGLNFGDCFAYALAKEMGEPLLFRGDDFRHTDIEPGDGA